MQCEVKARIFDAAQDRCEIHGNAMVCSDIIGSKLEEAGVLLPLRGGAIGSDSNLGDGRNGCSEPLGCGEPAGILCALVEVAGVEAVSIEVQEPCMPVDDVTQDEFVGWFGLVWVPSREGL